MAQGLETAQGTQDTVVVGYDGSSHADAALDWATREARRRGAGLRVVHAADYPGMVPGPTVASPWVPAGASDAAAEVTRRGVRRAAELAPDLEITERTTVGSPPGALVEESVTAGLLVVGTRGRGNLAGALLGSVAFAVSAHAHCPVVVVRGDGSRHPGPDHPVVVGVDGSPAAQAALRLAARTAAETSAPLLLVAAWQPPAVEAPEAATWTKVRGDEVGESARGAATQVVTAAEQAVRAEHPGLTVRGEVHGGSPAVVLGDMSAGAGMVVVGARGRGGFTGLLLGSVSHGVIQRARVPVAVVRG